MLSYFHIFIKTFVTFQERCSFLQKRLMELFNRKLETEEEDPMQVADEALPADKEKPWFRENFKITFPINFWPRSTFDPKFEMSLSDNENANAAKCKCSFELSINFRWSKNYKQSGFFYNFD